jgi:SAM-dependent methyltransferase
LTPSRCLLAFAVASLLAVGHAASATTRAECDRAYQPKVGQAGKDVIWVPTPDALVDKMLSTAKVTPEDFVVDLGAGDGKIAIAAAKRFGARALGIEYNPDMVRLAQCYVQADGVADRVTMAQGDIFKEDFSRATVVTMYLLPDLNLCVRHRLLAMRPGTRITSHAFTMGEWEPDAQFEADNRSAYLWIVPARVGGTWSLRGRDMNLEVSMRQNFQKVGGEVTVGRSRQPLLGASLDGDRLRFSFVDAKGVVQHFSGTVTGTTLQGDLRGSGSSDLEGSLRDAPGAAPWATMAANCERFYR